MECRLACVQLGVRAVGWVCLQLGEVCGVCGVWVWKESKNMGMSVCPSLELFTPSLVVLKGSKKENHHFEGPRKKRQTHMAGYLRSVKK